MANELEDAAARGHVDRAIKLARDEHSYFVERALHNSLYFGHFDLAERFVEEFPSLVAQSPALSNSHWWGAYDKRRTAHFLMRHEFYVPKNYWNLHLGNFIYDYMHRNWSPANHASWPRSLRKRIVAFLCAMARAGKGRQDLSHYVIRYVVTAHFH